MILRQDSSCYLPQRYELQYNHSQFDHQGSITSHLVYLVRHLEKRAVLIKVRRCRLAYLLAYCRLHNETTADVAEVPSLKVLCQT